MKGGVFGSLTPRTRVRSEGSDVTRRSLAIRASARQLFVIYDMGNGSIA